VEAGIPKRIKYKIDDTNRDKRIDSINRIAKELRPLGKVVHVVSSPNMQKDLLATLISINKEKCDYDELKAVQVDQKLGKNTKGCFGIYAIPVSNKLPWMQITCIPDEFL